MRCVRYDWQCLLVGLLNDLALDVERGLLYYSDYNHNEIAEITTKGSSKRDIITNFNRGMPFAIAVDSTSRLTKLITTSVCHTLSIKDVVM